MISPPLLPRWPGRDAESLLWLASYPRSGNTFVRILLANYFSAHTKDYDINKLDDFIPADTSRILWENAGISPPLSEPSENIWKARSAVIANYRKTTLSHALPGLKTHSANVRIFGVSGFDFRPNDRVIYIVRHPLDVLLSFADYNAQDIDSAIGMMITRSFAIRGGRAGALEARGSWSENVESWVVSPAYPLLLIRYEELSSSTETILRAILTFLHAPIIDEQVHHAVAASRFERLREQEVNHSFVEHPNGTLSGSFFREGKSLQWLQRLEPRQSYRLADACDSAMKMVGYTHPRDVLFDGSNALGPLRSPSATAEISRHTIV